MIRALFWFGVIGAVREWYYASKAGAPLARAEKWYLVAGFVLAYAVSAIADWIVLSDKETTATIQLSLSIVIIVWAARQMVRRTRSRGLAEP